MPRRLLHPLRWVGRILGSAVGRWVDVESYRLAAALAFYALMSLFPLLILGLAGLELVLGDSTSARGWLFEWLQASDSPAVRGTVEEALAALQERGAGGAVGLVVGVIGALIGASGVFGELDTALNRTFASERPMQSLRHGLRMLIHDRLWAFVAVLATMALILGASTANTFWEQVGPALAPTFGFQVGSFLLSTAALAAAVALCIHWIPDTRVAWRAAATGGGLAALLLQLLRIPFGWAVVRFTDYPAYGVVGSVLVVLLWMYVAAAVLLYGASVAAVLNRSPQPVLQLRTAPPAPVDEEEDDGAGADASPPSRPARAGAGRA